MKPAPWRSDAEIYDPALGTWSLTGSMSTDRAYDHSATRLADGRVLISGGYSVSSNGYWPARKSTIRRRAPGRRRAR